MAIHRDLFEAAGALQYLDEETHTWTTEGFLNAVAALKEYGIFTQYMKDYHQITPGWTETRTAWWKMLQEIGAGGDIEAAAKAFDDTANEAAAFKAQ